MSRKPEIPRYFKDPNANKDYPIDWTDWLAEISDTISSVAWTVPAGITQTNQSNTTTRAVIWLSGGTLGTTYEIGCRITTAGGRIEDQTILVEIRKF